MSVNHIEKWGIMVQTLIFFKHKKKIHTAQEKSSKIVKKYLATPYALTLYGLYTSQ